MIQSSITKIPSSTKKPSSETILPYLHHNKWSIFKSDERRMVLKQQMEEKEKQRKSHLRIPPSAYIQRDDEEVLRDIIKASDPLFN